MPRNELGMALMLQWICSAISSIPYEKTANQHMAPMKQAGQRPSFLMSLTSTPKSVVL